MGGGVGTAFGTTSATAQRMLRTHSLESQSGSESIQWACVFFLSGPVYDEWSDEVNQIVVLLFAQVLLRVGGSLGVLPPHSGRVWLCQLDVEFKLVKEMSPDMRESEE